MKVEYLKLFALLLPGLVILNPVQCMTAEEIPEVEWEMEAEERTEEEEIIAEPPAPVETEQAEYTAAPIKADIYEIPHYAGMKKWMDYRSFKGGSDQKLLQQYAITDSCGLRQVAGAYCVAVGSRFGTEIGQRFDLVLENGMVIPCVMGDMKADAHTDPTNTFTNMNRNLCCSEFIVSAGDLPEEASRRGDASFVSDTWQSPVARIIVYNINVLDEFERAA